MLRAVIGPDIANLNGCIKNFCPLPEGHRESIGRLQTGKGIVMFSLRKDCSAYSKNEVEKTKWKLRGRQANCCICLNQRRGRSKIEQITVMTTWHSALFSMLINNGGEEKEPDSRDI